VIFLATETICHNGKYFDADSFFSRIGSAFGLVKSQVLKLETRQEYYEESNKSLASFLEQDFEKSKELLPESRLDDIPLYFHLSEMGIDFIRCRPIKFPLSKYIEWEMNVYKFNAMYCERIFCCNYLSIEEILLNYAHHDFMVFDSSLAFIHDYNQDGKICGGWEITNIEHIIELEKMFIFIKSQCQPFNFYVR
jgi:hypothetical protein